MTSHEKSITAEEILEKLTLDKKLALTHGANFWQNAPLPEYGLNAITMADGPHGLRYQEKDADMLGMNQSSPATCFPTASISACSWDENLIREMASVITKEAAEKGVYILLGPALNIKRNPLCGRNFEYFSEDPYLAGKLSAAFIRGGQENDVGTCLKHFAANSQEYRRQGSDSRIDERSLREIYLTAFEIAVKEGHPDAIMCAYNKINGTYCSDNKWLVSDVLRDEWGFDGIVLTDWGAMHDRVAAYKAGCDLAMPGGTTHHQRHIREAIKDGILSEEDVDQSALRVLNLMKKYRQNKKENELSSHHSVAKKVALESAVLLKNNGILPLKTDNVCLIGHMAEQPRYQGAGSSHINPTRLTSLKELAKNWAYTPGYNQNGSTNDTLLKEAVTLAETSHIAVVVAGLPDSYESEGFDRTDMKMPAGHLRVIEEVSKANPNTVVLLVGGSPMELPWFDQVKAILYIGLPGQAGYEAAYELLIGQANPCGKLAESWPIGYGDTATSRFYGAPYKTARYLEGIYVGYRYYETIGKPVRFPFGYGLSYTTFEYGNLKVDKQSCTDRTEADLNYKIKLTVKNTGSMAGTEVIQLYIAPHHNHDVEFNKKKIIYRPAKELKGFQKIFLGLNEEKTVEFMLDDRSFAIWQDGWKIQKGQYQICIGASVQDIRVSHVITITDDMVLTEYRITEDIVTETTVEKLEQLGHIIIEETPTKPGEYTMENSIVEMAETSLILRVVKWAMEHVMAKKMHIKVDYANPEFRMYMTNSADAALFSTVNNAGDMFKEHVAEALVDIGNKRFLSAIKKLLKK